MATDRDTDDVSRSSALKSFLEDSRARADEDNQELFDAALARVEDKRERQRSGNPVPSDKSPL